MFAGSGPGLALSSAQNEEETELAPQNAECKRAARELNRACKIPYGTAGWAGHRGAVSTRAEATGGDALRWRGDEWPDDADGGTDGRAERQRIPTQSTRTAATYRNGLGSGSAPIRMWPMMNVPWAQPTRNGLTNRQV